MLLLKHLSHFQLAQLFLQRLKAILPGLESFSAMIWFQMNVVLFLKPKSIKQRSKPNDKTPLDTTVYGVRFFVEISHVWSSRENITVLTKEIINNYVNKQKGKP